MNREKQLIHYIESELMNRKFKHRTWFKGENVTVAYALSKVMDTWIEKKEKKIKGESAMFGVREYDYVVRVSKSRSYYKLKDDMEIVYYLIHALQYETEAIEKLRKSDSVLNIDWLEGRYKIVKKEYERIMNECIDRLSIAVVS